MDDENLCIWCGLELQGRDREGNICAECIMKESEDEERRNNQPCISGTGTHNVVHPRSTEEADDRQ